MSSPSQEELDQQFKTLQTEIRQRFPITGRSPSRRGVLLLDVGNHIRTKAAKVWSMGLQSRPRPDRHYCVGFALKCDLEILGHYLQIEGSVSTETIVSGELICTSHTLTDCGLALTRQPGPSG
jgi:hypothetical protein